MMKWDPFPGAVWIIFGLTLALIVVVRALGASVVLDEESANADIQSAPSAEYVRGLEARISYLEALNANMEVRLDRVEREQSERKTVLDDLVQRDAAARRENEAADEESPAD